MNLTKKIKDYFKPPARLYFDASKLSEEQQEAIAKIAPDVDFSVPQEVIGDGGAEFFGEGTEAEWEEQKKVDSGLDKWYRRILR